MRQIGFQAPIEIKAWENYLNHLMHETVMWSYHILSKCFSRRKASNPSLSNSARQEHNGQLWLPCVTAAGRL